MRRISVTTGDDFAIEFPYDPDLLLAVKALPYRRWDNQKKHWIVPVSELSCEAVDRFGEAWSFELTTPARWQIDNFRDEPGFEPGTPAYWRRREPLISDLTSHRPTLSVPPTNRRRRATQ